MSNRLEQYGVTINGTHSYKNLKMVSVSPLFIAPAEPKLTFLDVPGRQDELDLTYGTGSFVPMGVRSGTWKFKMFSGTTEDIRKIQVWAWQVQKRLVTVKLDDDTETYNARITLDELNSDGVTTDVQISYEIP